MAPLVLIVTMVASSTGTTGIVPFSAKYSEVVVERGAEGGERRRQHDEVVYRDSRGRTRHEFVLDEPDGPVRLAFLYDRESRRVILIDLDTGVEAAGGLQQARSHGHRPIGAPHGQRPVWEGLPQASGEIERREALGERTIQGLRCRGSRTHLRNGDISEVWFTEALPDLPILVNTTTGSGYSEQRLFDIRVGEPPPELYAPLETRTRR